MGSPRASSALTDRVRLRRKRERGSFDRALIDAILDEALIAHLGITDHEGRPLVIPTLHARHGDLVYLHGSSASRTIKALQAGAQACLTVSLLDGLVLARAAMHHSANYRSVMLFGVTTPVQDPEQKLAALQAIVEHIVPGRWHDVRAPSANELAATTVLALPIQEVSAKVRTGAPVDDAEDLSLPVWAGVIPMRTGAQPPEADPLMQPQMAPPPYASAYRRPVL